MSTHYALLRGAAMTVAVLIVSAPALAQQAKQPEDTRNRREEPALIEPSEYVNLPEIVTIGKRWRLDDEIREELWGNELNQDKFSKRERELERDRSRNYAVAAKTSSGGRFESESLRFYNPENPHTMDLRVGGSRSENELNQDSFNKRERELERIRWRYDAVATKTSSGGRFKSEFLPFYDPENPHTTDLRVDGSRSEVVELFKGSF